MLRHHREGCTTKANSFHLKAALSLVETLTTESGDTPLPDDKPENESQATSHYLNHRGSNLLITMTITRVASWGPDRRKWLFSEVRGGIWTPHSPVLIKISADKRPLNQLTVKFFFFIIHQNILPLTQSIWVFEWRKSVHYWWSYILFSPECKELTSMLDPLLYRWGVPLVVISVCALDHANVGTADLD